VLVLVRYHEIALKGRNRPFFVDKLARNLGRATADIAGVRVRRLSGRISVEVPDTVGWDEVRARIGSVFGVANFSRIHQAPPDAQALEDAVVGGVAGRSFGSFRVTTRRGWKGFALRSAQIDRALGAAVQRATGARVDLHHPEVTLFVEVHKDRILFSFEKEPGPGGFPVGSSGRVIALLSGGIDSPVAAWRMMKRGCTVAFATFHSFPLQDRTLMDKARELARVLTRYQYRSRLLLVPFGAVQQAIVAACPAPLRVVLYRRFMVRIAEALAARHRAKALVTGESLGQVASQTLDNMAVIDQAASGPILRPLVGMDKEEITQQARRIGSYETSTLPDQDCCQLFVPRSPALAAGLPEVLEAERALDVRALIAAAVSDTAEERFVYPEGAPFADEADGRRML
jgi:thiamine biosynthesis protein ThiI